MANESDIARIRAKIDEIDQAILVLIAQRKEAALEIAKIKQTTGPKEDETRIKEILEHMQAKAKELGLKEDEIKKIWKDLIAYMIREQMEKHPY